MSSAASYGRKVRYAFNPFIAFGDTVEDARASATRLLTSDGSTPTCARSCRGSAPAMKSGCIGPPEHVREQLDAIRDMGIELFLFKLVPIYEQIALVTREIIEPFRREAAQQTAAA